MGTCAYAVGVDKLNFVVTVLFWYTYTESVSYCMQTRYAPTHFESQKRQEQAAVVTSITTCPINSNTSELRSQASVSTPINFRRQVYLFYGLCVPRSLLPKLILWLMNINEMLAMHSCQTEDFPESRRSYLPHPIVWASIFHPRISEDRSPSYLRVPWTT